MSNSNDTTIFENDIVICTGTSDSLTITNHDSMASTTSISTDSFTITDGDYTFSLDDTISYDNITSGTITTGFGTEWIDHLPAMSVVKEMCKHYPALEKALENFKTVYKMVEQDYKGNHENNDLF
jgi:hypothetical protein|tara:strand:- start:2815 stop:3189 length:375 start_codon:yes stop_codon:yes gene_type:complete